MSTTTNATAPETALPPNVFGIGDKVNFAGYADDVPDSDRVFTTGQILVITALPVITGYDENKQPVMNGYTVYAADNSGKPGKPGMVFEDEVTLEATAEQWGYDPNAAAKALKKGAKEAEKTDPPAAVTPPAKPAKPAKNKDATPAPAAPASKPPRKKAGTTEAAPEVPVIETEEKTPATGRRLASATTQPSVTTTMTPAVAAAVGDLTGLDLLATVDELVRRIDESYFTLGGTLAVVKDTKAYTAKKGKNGESLYDGKAGFAEYCEAQGIGYRKAMYQIEIYQFAVGLGLSEQDFNRIGWSKAKEIARLDIDASEVKKLLKYAETHTVGQVQEKIKKDILSDGTGGSDGRRNNRTGGVVMTRRTLALMPDQEGIVEQGLKRAKAMIGKGESGDPSDGAAVALIVEQWLQMLAAE